VQSESHSDVRERMFAATRWLPRLVARVPATVHAKLLVAFLAIVVLLITLGAVGLQVLSRVNRRAEDLVKRQERIAAYRQFQHDTLLPPSWSWNQSTLEATLRQLKQFGYEQDQLQFVAADDAELLARVRESYDQFVGVVGQVVELINSGKVADGRTLQLTQAGPLADQLERLTNDLVNKAEVDLVASIEASQAAYMRSRWVVIALGVGSIGLALVLGYAISWSLIGPVRLMDTRLRLLASGDLSQRVEVPNRDELGALAVQFNRMAAQLEESYAGLEQRNQALTASLEQQTATSEVLRVIARSPTDIQPVLDTVAESAARLCEALDTTIFRRDGDRLLLVAHHGPIPAGRIGEFALPLVRGTVGGRSVLDGRTIHVTDLQTDVDEFPEASENARRMGFRTILCVPLAREGVAIGAIQLRRTEAQLFTERQVALLQTFADQAVIAIENVRLFKELEARNRDLTEALEQQTATSEILRVISSSPTDTQPVLDTVAESAARLCEASDVSIFRLDDDGLRLVARHAPIPYGALGAFVVPLIHGMVNGRAVLERRTIHVVDLQAEVDEFPEGSPLARQFGYRASLSVPLLREGSAIGVVHLRRTEAQLFSERQVTLLQTFADQAVIAIENVRLFKELEGKNQALTAAHGQVTEALEQQTTTAEILRVISSSPADVQPVFDTIAESVVRLCDGRLSGVYRFDGNLIHFVAHHNWTDAGLELVRDMYPRVASRETQVAIAILDCTVVEVRDFEQPGVPAPSVSLGRALGLRSILVVPMLREGGPIGAIAVARAEAGLFSVKQIDLLTTFADQAVIAIENVRLFKELEARTSELTRSVQELKALGEVGRAVSSTLELETVLSTIVSRATHLAGMDGGAIYEYDEAREQFHVQATDQVPDELMEMLRASPLGKNEGAVGRLAVSPEPVQIRDIADESSYHSFVREILMRLGYRSLLAVPLLREDHLLGALAVLRQKAGEFSPEVVELLRTFATQSALAIHNARLFRELEEKSRQLEVASRHKSDFLANVSHELRTPMNAILGFNELILGEVYGEVSPELKGPLTDIQNSGQHLLRLINNVLDLSKIEAGRMELALADYSVQDTVEGVRASLQSLAAQKGLELLTSVPPDIPLARGDGGRITQCLLNLAGNSLNHAAGTGRDLGRAP
jgi:two-component system, NtrC family, sensor kinase